MKEALLRRQELKELRSESDIWRNSQLTCSKAGVHSPSVKNTRKTIIAGVE